MTIQLKNKIYRKSIYILSMLLFISTILQTANSKAQANKTEVMSFSDYHVKPFLKRATDNHSISTLVAGSAAVIYANYYDLETQKNWQQYKQMSEKIADIGDFAGSGLLGLGIFALQYKFDSNETHWMSHGRALVWGTIASSTLKVVSGRQRPSNNPNYHSFPSGHTTTAFATATALTYAYGWKIAIVAYPAAAFVGLSRLSDNMHWGSDVVGGAFLGYWAARASYYSKEDASGLSLEKEKVQFQWTPIVSHEITGASFYWIY